MPLFSRRQRSSSTPNSVLANALTIHVCKDSSHLPVAIHDFQKYPHLVHHHECTNLDHRTSPEEAKGLDIYQSYMLKHCRQVSEKFDTFHSLRNERAAIPFETGRSDSVSSCDTAGYSTASSATSSQYTRFATRSFSRNHATTSAASSARPSFETTEMQDELNMRVRALSSPSTGSLLSKNWRRVGRDVNYSLPTTPTCSIPEDSEGTPRLRSLSRGRASTHPLFTVSSQGPLPPMSISSYSFPAPPMTPIEVDECVDVFPTSDNSFRRPFFGSRSRTQSIQSISDTTVCLKPSSVSTSTRGTDSGTSSPTMTFSRKSSINNFLKLAAQPDKWLRKRKESNGNKDRDSIFIWDERVPDWEHEYSSGYMCDSSPLSPCDSQTPIAQAL